MGKICKMVIFRVIDYGVGLVVNGGYKVIGSGKGNYKYKC